MDFGFYNFEEKISPCSMTKCTHNSSYGLKCVGNCTIKNRPETCTIYIDIKMKEKVQGK